MYLVSKCTLRQTAPAIQTLSSTVLRLLDSTTSLLLPSLGGFVGDGVLLSVGFSTAADNVVLSLGFSAAADGVVLSLGFSAAAADAADAAGCLSLGGSVDDGDCRVIVTLVRSSMKSHDVRASAARPSGLHPSSTTSTIYNINSTNFTDFTAKVPGRLLRHCLSHCWSSETAINTPSPAECTTLSTQHIWSCGVLCRCTNRLELTSRGAQRGE